MSTKYEAFDADGKRHTRTTEGRTYTHCVVFHIPARGPDQYGHHWPAFDKTAWARTLPLAEKAARGSHYGKREGTTIEIVTARVI